MNNNPTRIYLRVRAEFILFDIFRSSCIRLTYCLRGDLLLYASDDIYIPIKRVAFTECEYRTFAVIVYH